MPIHELFTDRGDVHWILDILGDPLNIRSIVKVAEFRGVNFDYPENVRFYTQEDPTIYDLPCAEWDHEGEWVSTYA